MKKCKGLSKTIFVIAMLIFSAIPAVHSEADDTRVYQGTWDMTAESPEFANGASGQRYTIAFPGNGELTDNIWGTDIYTADSSIASAAVHAGLITSANGGTVTIEIRPGQSSYTGSTRNGVTSGANNSYSKSFVFITSTGNDCRVTPQSLSLGIGGIPSAGSPVNISVNAVSGCGGNIFYRYSYQGDYGTGLYDNPPVWNSMTPAAEYITENNLSYTFPTPGHYVIVVWAVPNIPSEAAPLPNPIPLIGTSLTVGN